MSIGFYVKAFNDMFSKLMGKFDIPQTTVIHCRSELSNAIACEFVMQVTITDRLRTLFKFYI